MRRVLAAVLLVSLGGAAVAAALAWRELDVFRSTAHGSAEEKVVVVAPGTSARGVVRVLARGGVLSDEETAWRYLRFVKRDRRALRAGEYAFAGPLRPDEVFERVYRGEVMLHRVTIPEGLRLEEVAAAVGRSGLATEQEFASLARDPAVARALAVPYSSLEGFLFPDTYSFPRGVTARGIAEAMVARFKDEYAKADAQRAPGIDLDMGQTATFASIVEKETGRADERPHIACVFHNRLRLGMPLQTDPTVMYATMLRTGRWSKNISRADLLARHPYNTYTTAGLPPGPISNAGAAALRAVLAPAACNDLFFVSRNDGGHVFCPDLACHNSAVRQWQVEFFRRSRAPARPGAR
jgi:UPF0755 protein